jgi:hypothetical protein
MAGRFEKHSCGLALAASAAATMIVAPSVSAASAATGRETISGMIGTTGTSGTRTVAGSVVVAKGVFNGVGKIVERPNHPGESDKISRDDLVFTEGTIHIRNMTQKASLTPDLRSCTFKVKAQQLTTIDGGTGQFAQATGTFRGSVTAQALARRLPDGSCDQRHAPLFELDNITGTGSLSY